MIRIFLKPEQIIDNKKLILEKNDYIHLVKVLRIKNGEKIEIVVIEKKLLEVKIINILAKEILVGIISEKKLPPQKKPQIALAQALTKQPTFNKILRLGTEIGINKFIPIMTERTIINLKNKNEKKFNRWQTILKEESMQTRRNYLPVCEETVSLKQFVEQTKNNNYDLKIVFWEEKDAIPLKRVLNQNPKSKNILTCVGPEGGFSQKEIDYLAKNDFLICCLGENILRSEVAGFTAAVMILYQYDNIDM